MHAKIENNQVVEYPILNLRQRLPEINLPVDLTKDETLPDGFVYVTAGPFPEYDADTRRLTPGVPVRTPEGNWVTSYDIVPLTDEELEQRQAQTLQALKEARQVEVDAIKVTTTAGHTFDGDERSQDRMGTTLAAMDEGDTGPWVLADNTVIQVTKAELREALRLARSAMAQIWVRPYL